MPTNMKIDYLELHARDFDAVEKFYSTVFGWKFTDYGPEYRAFTDGKIDGGFSKSEKATRADDGSAMVVIYADDLEAVLASVKEAGGQISREIFSFPGGRRFQFLDPHGNELGVWSAN